MNDVVAKFRSQAAANREAAKVENDVNTTGILMVLILAQGSHRVATILSLTADLNQEQLHSLLQGIAELSQHNAEVCTFCVQLYSKW